MRIVVAWDGSDGAQAALRQAQAVAGPSGQIDLVHVLNPLTDAADVQAPSTHEAMVILSGRAQATMAKAATPGMGQAVVILEHGEDIPDRLLSEALARGADLLVIASKRAAGWRGALGSVAQQVLQDATIPVLVVRA
ncbi:MAG: universal stress protein [Dehalococcoidia bacterium]|nr:MAG: universal stress protein [Dehalococcoidia bacterium]